MRKNKLISNVFLKNKQNNKHEKLLFSIFADKLKMRKNNIKTNLTNINFKENKHHENLIQNKEKHELKNLLNQISRKLEFNIEKNSKNKTLKPSVEISKMKIDKSRLFKRFSESFELDIDVNDLEDDKSVERSFGRFTNKSYDKQPVPVRCKVMFSRMGTIDTILERFDCQAYIECSWEDDELFYQILNLDNPIELDNLKKDLLRSQNSKEYLYNYAIKNLKDFKYNPETHWSPKIYIENTISGSQQEIKYKIEIADKFERRNSALTVVSSWLDESKQLIDLENFNDIIENNYTVRVIEMRFVNGIFYEVKPV